MSFAISPGQAHDAPEGRALLQAQGPIAGRLPLLMDRAYEDGQTRALARRLGMTPVVPPKRNRREPWPYNRGLYKKRNEIERLFRRLKAYRRVFTRFDKLDRMYLCFVCFALIVEALRQC